MMTHVFVLQSRMIFWSVMRSRRAALAQSGSRFSEEIMLRQKGRVKAWFSSVESGINPAVSNDP